VVREGYLRATQSSPRGGRRPGTTYREELVLRVGQHLIAPQRVAGVPLARQRHCGRRRRHVGAHVEGEGHVVYASLRGDVHLRAHGRARTRRRSQVGCRGACGDRVKIKDRVDERASSHVRGFEDRSRRRRDGPCGSMHCRSRAGALLRTRSRRARCTRPGTLQALRRLRQHCPEERPPRWRRGRSTSSLCSGSLPANARERGVALVEWFVLAEWARAVRGTRLGALDNARSQSDAGAETAG
jgi:hypothetical protein